MMPSNHMSNTNQLLLHIHPEKSFVDLTNKSLYLISVILINLLSIQCLSVYAQEVFSIKGSINFQGFPNRKLDQDNFGTITFLQDESEIEQVSFDVEDSKYNQRFNMSFFDYRIKIEAKYDPYIQENDIDFAPSQLPRRRLKRYTYDIHLLHKENMVEQLLEAAQSKKKNNPLKSIELIDKSLQISPKPRAYIYKVQILGQMIKNNMKDIPITLLKIADTIDDDDEFFSNRSPKFKLNFYIQYGDALSGTNDLNDKIDDIDTFANVIIRAYQKAINYDKSHAPAYQRKYILENKTGRYWDQFNTIKSFFDDNTSIDNENTIIVFLTDWLTSLELITGYPKTTMQEYIQTVNSNQDFKNKWNNLKSVLDKYSAMFEQRVDPAYKRINNARLLGDQLFP